MNELQRRAKAAMAKYNLSTIGTCDEVLVALMTRFGATPMEGRADFTWDEPPSADMSDCESWSSDGGHKSERPSVFRCLGVQTPWGAFAAGTGLPNDAVAQPVLGARYMVLPAIKVMTQVALAAADAGADIPS